MKECRECEKIYQNERNFCTDCGKELTFLAACRHCGHRCKEDAVFCTSCGTSLCPSLSTGHTAAFDPEGSQVFGQSSRNPKISSGTIGAGAKNAHTGTISGEVGTGTIVGTGAAVGAEKNLSNRFLEQGADVSPSPGGDVFSCNTEGEGIVWDSPIPLPYRQKKHYYSLYIIGFIAGLIFGLAAEDIDKPFLAAVIVSLALGMSLNFFIMQWTCSRNTSKFYEMKFRANQKPPYSRLAGMLAAQPTLSDIQITSDSDTMYFEFEQIKLFMKYDSNSPTFQFFPDLFNAFSHSLGKKRILYLKDDEKIANALGRLVYHIQKYTG